MRVTFICSSLEDGRDGVGDYTRRLAASVTRMGHAVQAMVLNGWGFVNHQRSLGPHFFQNPPPSQRIAPAMKARHLNDDTLGRARDTLYDCGVTALYSLIAATAAQRWGLAPTFAHLESTSFQVDGRSNSDEPPNAPVIHIPQGSSRDPRPDLHCSAGLDRRILDQRGQAPAGPRRSPERPHCSTRRQDLACPAASTWPAACGGSTT